MVGFPQIFMSALAHVLFEGAMNSHPSYQVYRDLFPGGVIPPNAREFLKIVYKIDMSRKIGQPVKFHGPTYDQLKALLKDECITSGVRGQVKELLAKCFGVVNSNNEPYTAADDKAGDQAIRFGIDRVNGILSIKFGTDRPGDNSITCAICVLEGPMEGFFYFDPKNMDLS